MFTRTTLFLTRMLLPLPLPLFQVENPVAVLDQEEAKKFLTGKAEDKYKFFMKATELARISNTFMSTCEHISELEDAKNKMQESLATKKEHVKDLKKRFDEHRALDKIQEQILEARALDRALARGP